MKAGDRLTPERLEDLDCFISGRGAVRKVGAEQGDLRRPVTDPYAEREARHQVDQGGEGDERLDDRPALARPASCCRGPAHQVVGPDPLVAQRLGRLGGLHDGDADGAGPVVIPIGWQERAESHPRLLWPPWWAYRLTASG
jgi:hypothetical protein